MSLIKAAFEFGHMATPRGYTNDFVLFLRGADNSQIQHFVEKVVFKLHELFPDPVRVVREPPYEIRDSGYRSLSFLIEVHFKTGYEPRKLDLVYNLNFHNNRLVRTEKWILNRTGNSEQQVLSHGTGMPLKVDQEKPQSSSGNVADIAQIPKRKEKEEPQLPYEELKQMVKTLCRTLECVVCTNRLPKNVLTCVNGHCICVKCRGGQVTCPTCREPFSNVKMNSLARRVSSLIPKKCRYEDCVFVMKRREHHERYCSYRPTGCKVCNQRVLVRELANHVKANHERCFGKNKEASKHLNLELHTVENCTTLIQTVYEHLLWEIKSFRKSGLLMFHYYPVFWGPPTENLYLKLSASSGKMKYKVRTEINMMDAAPTTVSFGLVDPQTVSQPQTRPIARTHSDALTQALTRALVHQEAQEVHQVCRIQNVKYSYNIRKAKCRNIVASSSSACGPHSSSSVGVSSTSCASGSQQFASASSLQQSSSASSLQQSSTASSSQQCSSDNGLQPSNTIRASSSSSAGGLQPSSTASSFQQCSNGNGLWPSNSIGASSSSSAGGLQPSSTASSS